MKSTKFKGFSKVFKHSLSVRLHDAKYRAITIIMTLLFLVGSFCLVYFLSSMAENKKNADFDVEEVFVVDEIGIGVPDYASVAELSGFDYGKDVKFTVLTVDAKEAIKTEGVDYLFVQKKTDDGYVVEIVTGKEIDASKASIERNISGLEDIAVAGLQSQIFETSGLSEEQIMQALIPVVSNELAIGEEDDGEMKFVIGLISSLVSVMIVYFMVLIYGVYICSEVPVEKTSKLVEQLLMSVSAYAIVSGKIIAGIVSCLLQLLCWIAGIAVGLYAGDMVIVNKYDISQGYISKFFEIAGSIFEGNGFSVGSIILAVVFILLGIAFYLIIAGLAGATLTKPEEASNVQGIFVIPLVASYFVIMMLCGIADGNVDIPMVFNFIPFTSAMAVPSNVLMGELSIPMAFACIGTMLVSCLIVMFIAARVYEGLLFFNGNKLKFKDVLQAIKRKQ